MTDTDRDDVRCPKCGSQTPIGHRCIVDDLEAIRNADLSDHPFMRAIRGKTDRDDVGMLAEVLAVHQLHSSLNVCLCGTWRAMAGAGPLIDQHRDHLAAALLASSAMADLKARWQGEALREAADEVQRIYDMQCPPMPADRYVDRGAWMAHRWWSTVLGGTLRGIRDRADRTAPTHRPDRDQTESEAEHG